MTHSSDEGCEAQAGPCSELQVVPVMESTELPTLNGAAQQALKEDGHCSQLLCAPVQVLRQADRVCRDQSLALASMLLSMLSL